MKYSARIATLSALLAVVCAPLAQAARGIQTDDGTQGWNSCAFNNTCAFWADDASLALKSMGLNLSDSLDPLDPLSFGAWKGEYKDGVGFRATLGNQQQFIYYFGPNDGDWSIQFNYLLDFSDENELVYPDGVEGAVLRLGSDLTYSVKKSAMLDRSNTSTLDNNDFAGTFLNGAWVVNQAPSWWTSNAEPPTTNVPEPGTLALMAIGGLGLGLGSVLRRRQKVSALLQCS